MTNVIDWDKFHYYNMSPAESRLLQKIIAEYIDANSCFEDKSSAEMKDFEETFKNAWIIANLFLE